MSDEDVLKVPVELRDVDDVDEAALENIWIADQPLGILLKNLGQRVVHLENTVEELQSAEGDLEEVAPEP